MLAGIKLYYQVAGISGLLIGTLGTIVGRQRIMSVKPRQADHPILLRVPSTDVATYQQIFQSQEYRFEVGRQPTTIVDAGANVGLASVYFANRFHGAKIVAVEPEIGNFRLLEKNVALYPNVIPVHAALWDENMEISLVDPGLGESGFVTRRSNENAPAPAAECHKVRGMTVSSIMAEFDIERIDILKIDIEGAEREVLRDPQAWIDKVDAIIIELHERWKAGCEQNFESATRDFDDEWKIGENNFRSRKSGCLRKPVEPATG